MTRDASLIAVFAAEAGEPTPTWHTPIHPTHTENIMDPITLTLILASHSVEADAPDLVITDYSTRGEVLEVLAEAVWLLGDADLAALDDALCAAGPGAMVPVRYQVGDVVVTVGCVVLS